MQLPKLTPLQSRLLASSLATCLLVFIWIAFQPQHFVYAAELPLAPEGAEDSLFGQAVPLDSPIIGLEEVGEGVEARGESEGEGGYVGDFAYFDRSLIGRAPEGVDTLQNGVMKGGDLLAGSTRHFVLEKSQRAKRKTVETLDDRGENTSKEETASQLGERDAEAGDENLETRQAGNQVFISVNTCRQPMPNTPTGIVSESPPQLVLYVSTSSNNQMPGPNSTENLATEPIPFQNGFANFSLETDSDIFIGVSAPQLTQGWQGSFNFEVAASTERFFHGYNDQDPFLVMVDTDSESALFITHALTDDEKDNATIQKWMNLKSEDIPFTMYAFRSEKWGPQGVESSACGLREAFKNATANANGTKIDAVMSQGFGNDLPKAQFHAQNLDRNTTYVGYLAMNGNASAEGVALQGNLSSVGGGGRVWRQFQWTTKNDDSCQVIFGLQFCNKTAYAVPSSTKFKLNTTGLAQLYDNMAAAFYKNFTNSLAQVACDTTGTAQYSLARTCTECARDYKEWLCSVVMPRCEDWSATDPWLMERNINAALPATGEPPFANTSKEFRESKADRFSYNRSRNPMIDELIEPGPYKELLPCEDLCFDIVRSCPAQLGFACPSAPLRQLSYGQRDTSNRNNLTCNFPGAVVNLNAFRGAAGAVGARIRLAALVAAIVGGFAWI